MLTPTTHSAIWTHFGARAVNGDRSAISGLLETYRPILLALANKNLSAPLKSKVGASDIVQQTCEDAFVGITQVRARSGGQFWGWLSSLLAKNVADIHRRFVVSQKRSIRREVADGAEAMKHVYDDTPVDNGVIDAEVAEQLHIALSRLPLAYREVLKWRFLESHSCKEIGEVVSRTEDSVRMMVHRALLRLGAEFRMRAVLHRDLKPSNILLQPETSDPPTGNTTHLIPLLTDFGLAKRVNDPVDQKANLSDGVQMLGTLRYSSPEQAAGRVSDIGIASDVYSLGTILYQCLSGSPPHDGDSNGEILRRVLQEPVRSLRARNPDVSVDLDNVVLKSLSRERQDRYATAGEFAADLRRFLRGEPVLARRASIFRRIRFWARKNPAFAALAALFVITTTTTLSAVVWLYLGQRDALMEAETHREVALRTVAVAYDDVAQTLLENVPNTTEVRCSIALKSLQTHLELVEQFKGNALSRYRLSVAYHYAAKTVGALDRLEERDKYFTECMAILEQLIKEDPSNVDYRFDLFFNKRLWVVFHTDETFEWRAAELRKLVLEIDQICRMEPDNLDYRDVDSATKMDLADMLAPTRPTEAIPLYLGAAAVSDELLRQKPTNSIYSKYALVGRARAAEIYLASGQLKAAEDLCQKMGATLKVIPPAVRREILFEEIEREPQDAYSRLLVLQDRCADAIPQLQECELRYQRLLQHFPESAGFEIDHLRILALQHQALMADGKQAEAASVKAQFLQAADSPAARTFGPPGKELVAELLKSM